MEYIKKLVGLIAKDLRHSRNESVYRTSKESGLRPDVINNIESGQIDGRAISLARYIDSYCNRFPASAYKMFYNMSIDVAQQNVFK